jgi:ADP-ribosylglycohydrolase
MKVSIGKVQACLLGVQIGDALGQPTETMNRESILMAEVMGKDGTRFKHSGQPVKGFLPAIQTRIRQTAQLQAGDTTDDWQLTKAVAQSLVARSGYDQEDVAKYHAAALSDANTGWGGTTEHAIKEISVWFDTQGQSGRSPHVMAWDVASTNSGSRTGAGNGVAMKVSPLAIFHALHNPGYSVECGEPSNEMVALMPMVKKLAGLTHPSSEAYLTAYALAVMIAQVLVEPVYTLEERSKLLRRVRYRLGEAERQAPGNGGFKILSAFDRLSAVAGDPEAVFREIIPGFRAGESVQYAMGIFLCYPKDFRKAVLTAVNDGGDSDSTASMIGALVGANCGLEAIPEEWSTFRPEFQESIDLGTGLYQG